jgi:hypothetical protein
MGSTLQVEFFSKWDEISQSVKTSFFATLSGVHCNTENICLNFHLKIHLNC